ncbi:hypothetical protein F5X96DRAFT_668457 [Biscogniauxia mediterranea]|nr:hypothetical protein F5X96DRAFT_668457 [Biscogniauxia mediterranea]
MYSTARNGAYERVGQFLNRFFDGETGGTMVFITRRLTMTPSSLLSSRDSSSE